MERENCKITAETTGRRNNDNGIYSSPDPGGTAVAYRYRLAIQVPPQPPPPPAPLGISRAAPRAVSPVDGRKNTHTTGLGSGVARRGVSLPFFLPFFFFSSRSLVNFKRWAESIPPPRPLEEGGRRHASGRRENPDGVAVTSCFFFFLPSLFWAFFFRIPFLSRACQSRGRHCLFMPLGQGGLCGCRTFMDLAA